MYTFVKCVYLYTCVHIYPLFYVFIHMYTHMYTHIKKGMYTHAHMRIFVYICICIPLFMHVYTYVYTYTYLYIYIYKGIHTCTYTLFRRQTARGPGDSSLMKTALSSSRTRAAASGPLVPPVLGVGCRV